MSTVETNKEQVLNWANQYLVADEHNYDMVMSSREIITQIFENTLNDALSFTDIDAVMKDLGFTQTGTGGGVMWLLRARI